jgi:hypothetical protein
MIRKFYLSTILTAVISLIASCGGGAPANDSANKSTNANSNSIANQSTAQKRNEAPTENNAPTLGPVVQQYNEALRTKNDQMLRDTLTADFAKSLEQDMKDAKRKDFAAYIAEGDYRPGQVLEVRNEKIQGNKGVAEIRGGAYPNWTLFSFTLENGKWRFDNGSPETENMPPSNTNSTR